MKRIEELATELFKELFNQPVKFIEKENDRLEWLNIYFENNSKISLGKEGNIVCGNFLMDFIDRNKLREFAIEQYKIMSRIADAMHIDTLKKRREKLQQEINDIEKLLKDGKE